MPEQITLIGLVKGSHVAKIVVEGSINLDDLPVEVWNCDAIFSLIDATVIKTDSAVFGDPLSEQVFDVFNNIPISSLREFKEAIK